MNEFKKRVFETIRIDFAKYLDLKDRVNTTETKKRYMDDLDDYIGKYLINRAMLEEYCDVFNKLDIHGFLKNRKSSTAKYALGNLLQFYHFNKKITDSDYLDIQNELKKHKSIKIYEADFLTEADINYVFNKLFVHETSKNEEYVLLKVIIVLSHQFMFEQKHIMNLKWEGIDFQSGVIRNPRSYDDSLVSEWMNMDEQTFNTLKSYGKLYISTHGSIKPNSYFLEHKRDNINAINNILGIINDRAIFYNHISTRVGIQKLIRSKILIDLEQTSGAALMNYYRIFGCKKDTQLNTSIKEYLARDKSKM